MNKVKVHLHIFFAAETAQVISRNVNYEIPALKKQITKCQNTQTVSIVHSFTRLLSLCEG